MPDSSRILLFGATGYTGDLTARALVARGARPTLIGRNGARLAALADELGLDSAVADADDLSALAALVDPGDVLVSTVGPFLRHGEPAVQVAAEVGADYLDSTGEGTFIRRAFEKWGPIAARKDAALLTAFGFDFVPGSLAGALALERAGDAATRLDIGYFVRGFGTSGGTRASIAGMLFEDGYTYADGAVQTARTGRRIARFDVGGRTLTGVSLPAAEHFALPTSYPQLKDVEVYLGMPATAGRGLGATALLTTPAGRLEPLKKISLAVVDRVVKGSTGGPTAAERAAVHATLVANAYSGSGELLASVTLDGNDPYDFTAEILAWGAIRAAAGGIKATGAVGPVGAFGLDQLADGCASAGLSARP